MTDCAVTTHYRLRIRDSGQPVAKSEGYTTTVIIRRPARVSIDDRGHNVWTAPIEETELELTAMPLEGEEAVIQRYIQGSVLLWEADGVTYRLEGELTLDEARALAESLE